MPTYELSCETCGRAWERFMPRLITAEDRVCPGCGSTEVKIGLGGGYFSTSGSMSTDQRSCDPKSPGGG